MAKKKSKKRRSTSGPAGRPGAATKAQARQSQKPKKSGGKGGRGGKGAKKEEKEPRTVFDLAKGTSQAQRVTIAAVVVVLAAVAGLVAGRSAGSNPERYNDESAAVDAAKESDGFEATSDNTQLTAGEAGVICVPADDAARPTKGQCGTPAPATDEGDANAANDDANADGATPPSG